MPRSVLDQLLPSKPGLSKSSQKAPGKSVVMPQIHTQPKSQPVSEKSSGPKPTPKYDHQPPVYDSVHRVMKIISEETGLDVADLTPNVELADHGIDSLLSLTILGRVNEEANLEMPPTLFADCPTVKDLTVFLGASDNEPASPASSGDDELLSTPASNATSESYQNSTSTISESENLVECIRTTISEETGIISSDLKPSTSFSELGIDSLLSLTIMGRLSEKLEMEVPQSLLADNDTIEEVEVALGLPSTREGGTETMNDRVTLPVTADFESPPHATSVLLQGSPKSAKKTLFLFPDGSGSATSYATLPKVSSDIAVYGLNCPWQKTPQDMNCSLEFAASKYLNEIYRRQANGPYYFGGWSAGGILAYESAQQLARKGETTARLILIDSPNPVGLENPPERMYDFFDTLDFFGTKGKAAPSWLRPHFNAFLTTLDNYKVRPFAGPALQTHIVFARDGICKNPSDPRPEVRANDPREMIWLLNNRTDFSGAGWGSLVGKENLKVHVLDDVNHFSMVASGPKIADLSAFIKRAML